MDSIPEGIPFKIIRGTSLIKVKEKTPHIDYMNNKTIYYYLKRRLVSNINISTI